MIETCPECGDVDLYDWQNCPEIDRTAPLLICVKHGLPAPFYIYDQDVLRGTASYTTRARNAQP
jgi:hypothetical protein